MKIPIVVLLPLLAPMCEPDVGPTPVSYPVGYCDTITAGMPGYKAGAPGGLRQIGTSVQGRPILAEYHGPASPAKVVVVIGQLHGNECSPQLFTEQVRQYDFQHVGVWLVPTTNPDGHTAYTRRNANGADLNADGYYKSQPETKAMLSFIAEINPAYVVHVHSPGGWIGYYGSGVSTLAQRVASSVGMKSSFAGQRSCCNYFAWQAHPQPSLLVELNAIASNEVTNGTPRPPEKSPNQVRQDVHAMLAVLDVS